MISILRTIILIVLACCAMYMDADAATFYVNSSEDLPNANPGNREALATNGKVTLRSAIEEANALPGPDEIVFTNAIAQNSQNIGIAYLEGPLVIEDDLTVVRDELIPYVLVNVRGDSSFRVLEVRPSVRFEMEGIRFGEGPNPTFQRIVADRGAGMYIAPGAEVILSGCSLAHGFAHVAGGGIYVDEAVLEVRGSGVNGRSESDGGGIYNNRGMVIIGPNSSVGGRASQRGGCIFNDNGVLTIESGRSHAIILNGLARLGGAIYSSEGLVEVESALMLSNEAEKGAVAYLADDASAHFIRTSFRENHSEDGGTIYVESGQLRVSQSIFFDNTSAASGSTLYAAGGDSTLINCTITENSVGVTMDEKGVASGGAIAVDVDGGATVRIGNSIVAGNLADGTAMSPDIAGTVVSLGHNIIGDASGAEGLVASDLTGTAETPLDPMLSYRRLHEGSFTAPDGVFDPQPGSPAIDGGDNSLLAHPNFVGGACNDFRRSCCPRIRNGVVDIGAIEVQEGADAPPCGGHSADRGDAGRIGLEDLLRVIQFFNSRGLHCDEGGEDGYAVGVDESAQDCAPHSSDYNPQDWQINLSEVLRAVQLYNTGAYHPCPEGEDGFCVGAGTVHALVGR